MIEEQIKKILSKQFGCNLSKLRNELSLQNDLGADSVDSLEIATDLEEHFNITIDEEEYQNVKTIADLIELVSNLNGRVA